MRVKKRNCLVDILTFFFCKLSVLYESRPIFFKLFCKRLFYARLNCTLMMRSLDHYFFVSCEMQLEFVCLNGAEGSSLHTEQHISAFNPCMFVTITKISTSP